MMRIGDEDASASRSLRSWQSASADGYTGHRLTTLLDELDQPLDDAVAKPPRGMAFDVPRAELEPMGDDLIDPHADRSTEIFL